MKELSLNILDITQNSISANASLIKVCIEENLKDNFLKISIIDNGKGMSKEFLDKVSDPFTTTRTTRKVGMGIPLFKLSAMQCNGNFEIQSEIGCGTTVTATYEYSHIDRPPLGDIAGTIALLVSCNQNVDFYYRHLYNSKEFIFDTKEIKQVLNGVPLDTPDVVVWMKEYINDNIKNLILEE